MLKLRSNDTSELITPGLLSMSVPHVPKRPFAARRKRICCTSQRCCQFGPARNAISELARKLRVQRAVRSGRRKRPSAVGAHHAAHSPVAQNGGSYAAFQPGLVFTKRQLDKQRRLKVVLYVEWQVDAIRLCSRVHVGRELVHLPRILRQAQEKRRAGIEVVASRPTVKGGCARREMESAGSAVEGRAGLLILHFVCSDIVGFKSTADFVGAPVSYT